MGHEHCPRRGVLERSRRDCGQLPLSDVFRTIELNPSERERFLTNIHDVVAQKASVEQLLEARRHLAIHPT